VQALRSIQKQAARYNATSIIRQSNTLQSPTHLMPDQSGGRTSHGLFRMHDKPSDFFGINFN
jgi:hypothetical protein